jgi:biopolymer transport protein ExbD
MKLRKLRRRRRGRIEIIPMIDVMFFLLATFMLASLALQNLHSLRVDLPQGHAAPNETQKSVTLTVTSKGDLLLNETPVRLGTLADALRPLLEQSEKMIVVAADKAAPNGVVVQAMLQARVAGAEQFVFAIRAD